MNKEWKNIKGYDGRYIISNTGNIKSMIFGIPKTIKSHKDYKGYLNVVLSINGGIKKHKVHRLVYDAFIGLTEDCVIDHINCNKSDNRLINLRECTVRENTTYHYEKQNKLTKYTGVYINGSTGKRWVARIYKNGKHTHIGYFDTDIEAHNAYQKELNQIAWLTSRANFKTIHSQ